MRTENERAADRDRILKEIREYPGQSANTLSLKLLIPYNQLYMALKRLCKEGKVTRQKVDDIFSCYPIKAKEWILTGTNTTEFDKDEECEKWWREQSKATLANQAEMIEILKEINKNLVFYADWFQEKEINR